VGFRPRTTAHPSPTAWQEQGIQHPSSVWTTAEKVARKCYPCLLTRIILLFNFKGPKHHASILCFFILSGIEFSMFLCSLNGNIGNVALKQRFCSFFIHYLGLQQTIFTLALLSPWLTFRDGLIHLCVGRYDFESKWGPPSSLFKPKTTYCHKEARNFIKSHSSASIKQSDFVKQGLTSGYYVKLMKYTGTVPSKLSPDPVDKYLPSKYFRYDSRNFL
jgi:hypothetical protein